MRPQYKEQILALRTQHPMWTQRQIADEVGCHIQTVRYNLSEKERKSRKAIVQRYAKTANGKARRTAAGRKWRDRNPEAAKANNLRGLKKMGVLEPPPPTAEQVLASIDLVLASIGYRGIPKNSEKLPQDAESRRFTEKIATFRKSTEIWRGNGRTRRGPYRQPAGRCLRQRVAADVRGVLEPGNRARF